MDWGRVWEKCHDNSQGFYESVVVSFGWIITRNQKSWCSFRDKLVLFVFLGRMVEIFVGQLKLLNDDNASDPIVYAKIDCNVELFDNKGRQINIIK